MTSPLSFDFKDCVGTAGLEQGAAISGYATPPRSPHGALSLVPAYGHLLVLNGRDVNQQVVDFAGTALGTSYARLMVSAAPFGTLVPMVGGLGAGRVRGDGYKWLFRLKNSSTGEVTGLSERDPGAGASLGVELTAGGYLGQDAYFQIGVSRVTDAAYMDTVQVFRNTTDEETVFYLEKELTIPPGGGTVYFHDDLTDDDLILSGSETDGISPNPSFAVGPPPPMAKAFLHPNGRTMLYGGDRVAPWRGGSTAAVVNGSRIVTTDVAPPYERQGQRFAPLAQADKTAYRVCCVRPDDTGAANSQVIFAIDPPWAGATGSVSFEIDDDRDLRLVWPSMPGRPTQFDVTQLFGVGADRNDPLVHMSSLRGSVFAFTRGHGFLLQNDGMTDPDVPVLARCVTNEGPCGLFAAADTPDGVVYVEATLGVRTFSGIVAVRDSTGDVVADPPRPLGGSSPTAGFGPLTQFRGIDPGFMRETRVFYDRVQHRVYVSYCPLGDGGLSECLAYQYEDPEAGAPAVWRGPWRVSMSCLFELRDDDGAVRVCLGDEQGNVLTDDGAAADVLDQDVGQSLTGTVLSVTSAYVFLAVSGTFDPSADKRLVGCPVVLTTTSTGAVQVNRIAGFDGTAGFTLLYAPSPALVAGDTFRIAAVRWQAKTAWIDGGEPMLPKMLERLRMRLARGSVGSSTAELAAACDGSSTFLGEGGASFTTIDPAPTVDGVPTVVVYSEGRLRAEVEPGVNAGGRCHQIRVRGTSVDGHPRIEGAVADVEIREGA